MHLKKVHLLINNHSLAFNIREVSTSLLWLFICFGLSACLLNDDDFQRKNFFEVETDRFELRGLNRVQLFGKANNWNNNEGFIGFQVFENNQVLLEIPGDIRLIGSDTFIVSEEIQLDVRATYQFRAIARENNREVLGSPMISFSFQDFFSLQFVDSTNIRVSNDTAFIQGAISGLTDKNFVADEFGVYISESNTIDFNDKSGFRIKGTDLARDEIFPMTITGLRFNTEYNGWTYMRKGDDYYCSQRQPFKTAGGWSFIKNNERMTDGIAVTTESYGLYFGLGSETKNCTSPIDNFWQFDSQNFEIGTKRRFPGTLRCGAVAFSIKDTIYYGLGETPGDGYNESYFNDLWAYIPENNEWKAIISDPFPGEARADALVFVIDDKAYVGTGANLFQDFKDFYVFDPSLPEGAKWEPISASFPGKARYNAVATASEHSAIVGLGEDEFGYFTDFYRFTPGPNGSSWESIGGTLPTLPTRIDAIAFSIQNRFFVGLGNFPDQSSGENIGVFRADLYELIDGQWSARSNFPGQPRANSAITIQEDKLYLFGGEGSSNFAFESIWRYTVPKN